MTEAQPVKLTKIVFDYPVAEKDNWGHIDETVEPSEHALEQKEPIMDFPTDPNEEKQLKVETDSHRNNLRTSKGSQKTSTARKETLITGNNRQEYQTAWLLTNKKTIPTKMTQQISSFIS